MLVALPVLGAAMPSVASGGTVARDGTVISWTGDVDIDRVEAWVYDEVVRITEQGGVAIGTGCGPSVLPDSADCDLAGITAVVLDAGDGADRVQFATGPNDNTMPGIVNGQEGDDLLISLSAGTPTLNGGAGNDTLDGSFLVADALDGGAGDDILRGGGGGLDVFDGGTGDDTLVPGDGQGADAGDVISGGEGIDTLSYFGRSGDRTVTFDGVANDGAFGENDNVLTDVENYRGGNEVDIVVGSEGPNDLEGGPGTDNLDGGGGADILRSSRTDTLNGGAGDDTFVQALEFQGLPPELWFSADEILQGGPGVDTVDYGDRVSPVRVDDDGQADDGQIASFSLAGSGPLYESDDVRPDVERVLGSAGADALEMAWMVGGAGSDTLLDRPGAQRFDGGPGRDVSTYAARTADIDADADGAAADDGAPGEGDAIGADVEDLVGGSGDDRLAGNGSDNLLDGGPGDDELLGLGGVDTVDYSSRTTPVLVDLTDTTPIDGATNEFDSVGGDVENVLGGERDDLLIGAAAGNLLTGGTGDDELDGAGGADDLRGGPGFDVASYAQHGEHVVADLDGQPGDDGASGEHDTLGADLEGLVGGAGNDTLIGNIADNLLDGGPGADALIGATGLDAASYASRTAGVTADPDGAPGDDGEAGEGDTIAADVEDVIGGAGNDRLSGNGESNFLIGGPGVDRLDGGGGEDALLGEDGDDDLTTRDGAVDFANCGSGDDLVRPDAFDDLVDCDRRDDGLVVGPPPPPPEPDRVAPTIRLRVLSSRLASVRRSGLRVRIACSEPCTVRASLTVDAALARRLRLPQRTLGRADARIVATTKTLVVKLGSRARRALRTRRSLRTTLTVTATDASRNSRKTRRAVRLR